MSTLAKPKNTQDPIQYFRELADAYAQRIKDAGFYSKPYKLPSLPKFSALTQEKKSQAIDDISLALEVIDDALKAGHALTDSPQLLWRSLRKLRLVPQSDIFDRIEDEDVINVYSLEQKQIFQNLRFFDYVSLTLEDLYTDEWYRYSKRDESAQKALYELGVQVATGQLTKTIDPAVAPHVVDEVDTEGLRRFRIHVKWLSPVTRDGSVMGCIVVNRCEHLPSGANRC